VVDFLLIQFIKSNTLEETEAHLHPTVGHDSKYFIPFVEEECDMNERQNDHLSEFWMGYSC
jgi:hypothetical protein